MAIEKVCGIETEYGIFSRGVAEQNPTLASSVLVNSYANMVSRRVDWDFDEETPGNDARNPDRQRAYSISPDSQLANSVLTNGARLYVDHAHPEYSAPECSDPLSATLHDEAGVSIMQDAMKAASGSNALEPGEQLLIYKNNSDGKGNSYGCHENYLMDRNLVFTKLADLARPWLVTRQIMCGAGKVGSEIPSDDFHGFQISARSDFFEEIIGLETTMRRPIVNTRDEPHAAANKYRRFHVIIGDANMSQFSTFLKLGSTAIVLAMIEDGYLDRFNFDIAQPVEALRAISRDPELKNTIVLQDGRRITALEMQREYFAMAEKYVKENDISIVGPTGVVEKLMTIWSGVLNDLETDVEKLSDRIDWVAKKRLVDGYSSKHGLSIDHPKLQAMDLQYHDIRPEKSLFYRLGIKKLFSESEIEVAKSEPPEGTRAYFRGKVLQKWPQQVVAANWDSIVIRLDDGSVKRIPMKEPLRGTKELVEVLIRQCETPAELIAALGS